MWQSSGCFRSKPCYLITPGIRLSSGLLCNDESIILGKSFMLPTQQSPEQQSPTRPFHHPSSWSVVESGTQQYWIDVSVPTPPTPIDDYWHALFNLCLYPAHIQTTLPSCGQCSLSYCSSCPEQEAHALLSLSVQLMMESSFI